MRDFSSRPRRPGTGLLDTLLVALASLALLWSSAQAVRWWREARSRTRGVEDARGELDAARAQLSALESRPGDIALARQTLLTLDAPPPRVLAALAEVLPKDVRLESVSMRYGDRLELEMEVVARTSAAYDAFLDRLASSPRFETVLSGEENREGEVRASVRAGFRGGVS